jgi:BirA family biotin operon repressor/biotin-[acetyl-CoA-carboxylase] ligase
MVEESLSAAAITDGLATRFIGQEISCYPSLPSTNDVAKRRAIRGAKEGTVIVAEEQTAGRGRIKRRWLSPRGSIALSMILYPPLAYLPSLIMVASLAVAAAVEQVTGLKAQLKWPNDVLIHGKKVCGILVESGVRGGKVDYAVIGIGVNVNLKLSEYPEIATFATSLSQEMGRDVPRLKIVRSLLAQAEKLYLALADGDSVFRQWRDRLVTLGKEVQVSSGEASYQGIAESVAADGSLLLRRPDGSLLKIVAGDVTLRQ